MCSWREKIKDEYIDEVLGWQIMEQEWKGM